MKYLMALAVAALLALPGAGHAKGCIKGAAIGGVAGHFAGHHGALGAVAGCAIGHHEANKPDTERPSQDHGTGDNDNHRPD
jgi:hypothetical protein